MSQGLEAPPNVLYMGKGMSGTCPVWVWEIGYVYHARLSSMQISPDSFPTVCECESAARKGECLHVPVCPSLDSIIRVTAVCAAYWGIHSGLRIPN